MLVQCQNCGTGVSDSAQKCPKCAQDPATFLGEVVKCRECGFDFRPAYPECKNCGAPRFVAAPDKLASVSTKQILEASRGAENLRLDEAQTLQSAPLATSHRKQGGKAAYICTFLLANIIVNGFSGAIGTSISRGKSFSELTSIEGQLPLVALGTAISILGYAIIYGVSRALTRIVPLKALPWLIFGLLFGALLGAGQTYNAVAFLLGATEARLLALQTGVFTLISGLITLVAFWVIFRNQN